MSDPRRQNRLLKVVLGLAAISTAATVIIVLFGLPKIFSSADNSQAVKRGSDLQSCRSTYASQVTEATTEANDLVLRGLSAVGREDQAALLVLVTDPPGPEGAPIDEARLLVRERTEAYAAAVLLSRSDPNAFLAGCAKQDVKRSASQFVTCAEARAAGATPIRDGDPGWNPDLDADGDLVACE